MIARLIRIVPLIIVLALVAAVIYVVAMFLYSPTRAKEILIKLFSAITGALSAFFSVASLYALGEGNQDVLELFASFLGVSLVALGITLACRAVFRKHNPNYRKKPERAEGFRWLRFKK